MPQKFLHLLERNAALKPARGERVPKKCERSHFLRHNYAIENINSWTDDGFGFNQKLHALSKSMGHSAIESTKYYYSLVPRLAIVLAEHTNESEVIPEAPYESH
jgi:integrase